MKDTTVMLSLALGIIICLIGIALTVFSYMTLSEEQKKLDAAVQNEESKAKELADVNKKYLEVSKLIGFSKDPFGVSMPYASIILEEIVDKDATLATKYGSWLKPLYDTGKLKKLSPAEKKEMKLSARIAEIEKQLGTDEFGRVNFGDVVTAFFDLPPLTFKRYINYLSENIDAILSECETKKKIIEETLKNRDKLIGKPKIEYSIKGSEIEIKSVSLQPGQYQEIWRERSEQVKQKSEAISQIISETTSEVTTLEKNISLLRDTIMKLDAELQKEKREHNLKIQAKKETINNLTRRLKALEKRETVAVEFEKEPDGMVIFSNPKENYVYINLGKKDLLPEGTEFNVMRIVKGALSKPVAKIKVTKTMDDFSKAIVLELVNKEVKIQNGDLVYNVLFDKKRPKIFALAGTMILRYNNEDLARKIEEKGGKVVDEVNPNIMFLIVGKNYEKHPNYLNAQKYNLPIIREEDFYYLFGIEQ